MVHVSGWFPNSVVSAVRICFTFLTGLPKVGPMNTPVLSHTKSILEELLKSVWNFCLMSWTVWVSSGPNASKMEQNLSKPSFLIWLWIHLTCNYAPRFAPLLSIVNYGSILRPSKSVGCIPVTVLAKQRMLVPLQSTLDQKIVLKKSEKLYNFGNFPWILKIQQHLLHNSDISTEAANVGSQSEGIGTYWFTAERLREKYNYCTVKEKGSHQEMENYSLAKRKVILAQVNSDIQFELTYVIEQWTQVFKNAKIVVFCVSHLKNFFCNNIIGKHVSWHGFFSILFISYTFNFYVVYLDELCNCRWLVLFCVKSHLH